MKSFKAENFSWIFLENPDKDDLSSVQKIFNLHPIVLGEFNSPTYRPRVSRFDNYIFMVLHFPIFNKKTRTPEVGEIDIIFNDEYLVTSSHKHHEPLYYYFEQLNKNQNNPSLKVPKSSFVCLLSIIDIMLNSCFPKLDNIADDLDEIEKQVFEGKEKEMVIEISIVKRDILNFRRIMKPQRSILESLASKKEVKEDVDLKARMNDIIGSNIRIWNILETHKETIDSLEATNDSLFSHKINMNMRVLAVISILFLPATLAASLLGTNTNMPISNFWEAFLITGLLMLFTFVLIKYKKWL